MSVYRKNFSVNEWQRHFIPFEEDAAGRSWLMPYLFFQGKRDAPKVTLIAAIHGDELNGVRMLHELMSVLEERQSAIEGSLCIVPIANLMGYANHSRYLPDRRDLNRMFPGVEDGSEGTRLAHFIWENFIEDADCIIDVHSGSYNRWNYPHLRGNMKDGSMLRWASRLNHAIILSSAGVVGSLRKEAGKCEKRVFLLEAGEAGRFEKQILRMGLITLLELLIALDVVREETFTDILSPSQIVRDAGEIPRGFYRKGIWQRAKHAGLFIPEVQPGDKVVENQRLGFITDLFGEKRAEILSAKTGLILGMHLHPQVVPGRALFHTAYDFHELT